MRRLSAIASTAGIGYGAPAGGTARRGPGVQTLAAAFSRIQSTAAPPLQRFEEAFGARLDQVVTAAANGLSRQMLALHTRLQAEVERRKAGTATSGPCASGLAPDAPAPTVSEQDQSAGSTGAFDKRAFIKHLVPTLLSSSQEAKARFDRLMDDLLVSPPDRPVV